MNHMKRGEERMTAVPPPPSPLPAVGQGRTGGPLMQSQDNTRIDPRRQQQRPPSAAEPMSQQQQQQQKRPPADGSAGQGTGQGAGGPRRTVQVINVLASRFDRPDAEYMNRALKALGYVESTWCWMPNHSSNRALEPASGFVFDISPDTNMAVDIFNKTKMFYGTLAVSLPQKAVEILKERFRSVKGFEQHLERAMIEELPNGFFPKGRGAFAGLYTRVAQTDHGMKKEFWLVVQGNSPSSSQKFHITVSKKYRGWKMLQFTRSPEGKQLIRDTCNACREERASVMERLVRCCIGDQADLESLWLTSARINAIARASDPLKYALKQKHPGAISFFKKYHKKSRSTKNESPAQRYYRKKEEASLERQGKGRPSDDDDDDEEEDDDEEGTSSNEEEDEEDVNRNEEICHPQSFNMDFTLAFDTECNIFDYCGNTASVPPSQRTPSGGSVSSNNSDNYRGDEDEDDDDDEISKRCAYYSGCTPIYPKSNGGVILFSNPAYGGSILLGPPHYGHILGGPLSPVRPHLGAFPYGTGRVVSQKTAKIFSVSTPSSSDKAAGNAAGVTEQPLSAIFVWGDMKGKTRQERQSMLSENLRLDPGVFRDRSYKFRKCEKVLGYNHLWGSIDLAPVCVRLADPHTSEIVDIFKPQSRSTMA